MTLLVRSPLESLVVNKGGVTPHSSASRLAFENSPALGRWEAATTDGHQVVDSIGGRRMASGASHAAA